MRLTLQLTPELESEARQAAAREGLAPEEFAVAALRERLNRREVGSGDPTEASLLEQIGVGLPPEVWQRYHQLTAQRRSETLTAAEHSELLELTDRVEIWNAQRLELLLQLARLRSTPLRTLIEDLGLAPAPYV